MRSAFIGGLICVSAVAAPSSARQVQQTPTAQAVVQRDPQAVSVLQKAVAAMGGTVPADSAATGAVTVVAGSETDQGTIRILTRGTTQTSVQLQTPTRNSSEVFSGGGAAHIGSTGTATLLPMETAATSQSAFFPLPFMASALSDLDESCRFIGTEELNGANVSHVVIWNTYASIPQLQSFADFSATDVWLDSTTALPVRIAFVRRDSGGATSKLAHQVDFSDYRAVSGARYPYQIQESVNGTAFITITLQSVSTNVGLTDANFPVPDAGN
jgi:hypothetical protein